MDEPTTVLTRYEIDILFNLMRRLKGQGTTIICIYGNALVFLAADKTRLQGLDEAARRYLAWESIISEKDTRGISG